MTTFNLDAIDGAERIGGAPADWFALPVESIIHYGASRLKFFTSEWWAGCQRGDVDDVIEAFQAHAKAIHDRLTPDLLTLQERVSLHDARIISLSVVTEEQTAVLKLKLSDGSDLELLYTGLIAFESVQNPECALGGPGGYGDLGYDEIDVLQDGGFEHRMLFSTSIELRLRFAALTLRASAIA